MDGVAAFEVEYGSTNRVHIEYQDGNTVTYEGDGLTVSGETIDENVTTLPEIQEEQPPESQPDPTSGDDSVTVDIQFTSEGISVTAYGEGNTVLKEAWATWNEVENKKQTTASDITFTV